MPFTRGMTVVGLDLSATRLGVAALGAGGSLPTLELTRVKARGHRRLIEWGSVARALAREARWVALEAPAPAVRQSRGSIILTGAVHGVVTLEFLRFGIPVMEYPTQHAKMYATGSGAASKEAMQEAARVALGLEIPPQQDAADAYWILALDRALHGYPITEGHPERLDEIRAKTREGPVGWG